MSTFINTTYLAALALALSLSACTITGSPAGELSENKRILASCDKAAPPASDVHIDGTGSSASEKITEQRMTIVASVVRVTAICSGRLRVSVFSSSSSATSTLYEGALHLHGSTDNARLKRVPKVVDRVMKQIREAYAPAVKQLDRGGSDITAQYRLAGEWIAQLGSKSCLRLYILTDGLQNVGAIKLDGESLSRNSARALAGQVSMPKLPRAEITVAGLGRVAGKPPRSETAEGLVAFYDTLCRKTGAARCVSVSQYAGAGQ